MKMLVEFCFICISVVFNKVGIPPSTVSPHTCLPL